MNTATNYNDLPDPQEADLARDSAAVLARLLRERPAEDRARVQLDDGDLVLPRHAIELLQNILTEMAQGNAVTIMPVHAELSTQEAANMLNVSRPHLVKLLEQGELPYSRVGTHRRIKFQNLIAYKRKQDEESEEAVQALADQAQESDMGY
jgi:excisionase family DNA binding protein